MNWIKKWSTAALAALVAGALLGVACAHADGFRVYSHDIKDGQFQQDQALSQAYGLGWAAMAAISRPISIGRGCRRGHRVSF